jgi:hypothetical protein
MILSFLIRRLAKITWTKLLASYDCCIRDIPACKKYYYISERVQGSRMKWRRIPMQTGIRPFPSMPINILENLGNKSYYMLEIQFDGNTPANKKGPAI